MKKILFSILLLGSTCCTAYADDVFNNKEWFIILLV